MRKKIFVTRKIPEIGLNLLKEKYNLIVMDTPSTDKKAFMAAMADCHGLVSLLSDTVDEEVISCAPDLQIIANYAVGYNNINVAAAGKRNIWVTHTPGVLTRATAEIAFALMIGLTRSIVQADQFTKEGKFKGWEPLLFLGDELVGKTLGIIGMGRIGQDMALKSKAFGMKIVYHNRHPIDKNIERKLDAAYLDFDELIMQSDVISIHTPLTDQTRHMLDQKAFEKMKTGAYIINTSRGEVIDEQVMVQYLNKGRLKGVGLDVYEFEPKITSELMHMDNVILLPHIGSATIETRNKMSEMVAKNVIAALEDRTPENIVPEMRIT